MASAAIAFRLGRCCRFVKPAFQMKPADGVEARPYFRRHRGVRRLKMDREPFKLLVAQHTAAAGPPLLAENDAALTELIIALPVTFNADTPRLPQAGLARFAINIPSQ
jgi:hypothetical protein